MTAGDLRRVLLVVAAFAATLGISGYILWSGWAKSGAPPSIPLATHLLALAAVAAEIVTRTIKIQWSGAALRIPLRFATAMRVCLGGDFGASITPSRSGAEPARFLVLAEAGVRPAETILILFTELFLEMTSLCLLCAVLAFAFSGSGQIVSLMTAMIGGYATIVLAIGAFGYFLAHRSANGPPPQWARAIGLHAGRWRVIQRALRSLRSGIAALKHARLIPMAGAFVASMVHVSLRLAVLPIIALAMNPQLPLAKLVLWPLVFLYGGAVAPAPGGGGAVEFGFKFAFAGIMTPSVLGGALIWWRFYTFYLYVILGALAAGSTVRRALQYDSKAPKKIKSAIADPAAVTVPGTEREPL